jgi:hypothetical protein
VEPPAGTELITLLDHYSGVAWANAPLGNEVNVNDDRSRLSATPKLRSVQ